MRRNKTRESTGLVPLLAAGANGMSGGDPAVVVLDDDHAILDSLERLLTPHGYQVRLHAEPADFFSAGLPPVPACLLLDHQLTGGVTGVQVHAELVRRGWFIPTVFLTAHWNVQVVVNAMRAGADGFLTKPFDPAELVDAVAQAVQHARTKQQNDLKATTARLRAAKLTPREREIVRLIVAGFLSKEIADLLNIALVTVKVHRGRAMHKLGAGNSVNLVHLATLADITR